MSGMRQAEVTEVLSELKSTLQTVADQTVDVRITTGVHRYIEVVETTAAQLPGPPAATGVTYWVNILDADVLQMTMQLNEAQNAVKRNDWFKVLEHSSRTLAALPAFPTSYPHGIVAELHGDSLSKWLAEPGKPT